MLIGIAKPIRMIGDPDNQLPDKWSLFNLIFSVECKVTWHAS